MSDIKEYKEEDTKEHATEQIKEDLKEIDIIERVKLDFRKLPDFLKTLLNPFKALRTPNTYDWIELTLFYITITTAIVIIHGTAAYAISGYNIYSLGLFNGLFLSLFTCFVTWLIFEYLKIEKNSALNIFYTYVVSDCFLMMVTLIPSLALTQYFNVVGTYVLYSALLVMRVLLLCLGFEKQLQASQKNSFITAAVASLFLMSPHLTALGAAYKYGALEKTLHNSQVDIDLESLKFEKEMKELIEQNKKLQDQILTNDK